MYKKLSQIESVRYVPKYVRPRNRPCGNIKRLVIHRLGPVISGERMHNAVDVARQFVKTEKYAAGSYTGGGQPYHFIINPETLTVYQALPLCATAFHAGKYNRTSIGIAVLQDMRTVPLTPAAYDLLVALLEDLKAQVYTLNGRLPTIHGHSELAGGSADPNKQCPGKQLDMNRLRDSALGGSCARA